MARKPNKPGKPKAATDSEPKINVMLGSGGEGPPPEIEPISKEAYAKEAAEKAVKEAPAPAKVDYEREINDRQAQINRLQVEIERLLLDRAAAVRRSAVPTMPLNNVFDAMSWLIDGRDHGLGRDFVRSAKVVDRVLGFSIDLEVLSLMEKPSSVLEDCLAQGFDPNGKSFISLDDRASEVPNAWLVCPDNTSLVREFPIWLVDPRDVLSEDVLRGNDMKMPSAHRVETAHGTEMLKRATSSDKWDDNVLERILALLRAQRDILG